MVCAEECVCELMWMLLLAKRKTGNGQSGFVGACVWFAREWIVVGLTVCLAYSIWPICLVLVFCIEFK